MSGQMQYQNGKIFPNLAATKLNQPIIAVNKYGNREEKKKEEKKITMLKQVRPNSNVENDKKSCKIKFK